MSDKRNAAYEGARDIMPIQLGVIPFGIICGAVGVSVGMPEWASMATSYLIFAGASQLAALQLMADNASIAVVILTGLVINTRFFMYSASIAPFFEGQSPLKKAAIAYLLTDQAYATAYTRFTSKERGTVDKIWYFIGAGVTMWLGFNGGSVLGASLGSVIPTEWNLGFAIPLTFMALVVPVVKDRPTALSAIVGGSVAVAADPLPYNLGILAAAVCGILTGYAADRRLARG